MADDAVNDKWTNDEKLITKSDIVRISVPFCPGHAEFQAGPENLLIRMI